MVCLSTVLVDFFLAQKTITRDFKLILVIMLFYSYTLDHFHGMCNISHLDGYGARELLCIVSLKLSNIKLLKPQAKDCDADDDWEYLFGEFGEPKVSHDLPVASPRSRAPKAESMSTANPGAYHDAMREMAIAACASHSSEALFWRTSEDDHMEGLARWFGRNVDLINERIADGYELYRSTLDNVTRGGCLVKKIDQAYINRQRTRNPVFPGQCDREAGPELARLWDRYLARDLQRLEELKLRRLFYENGSQPFWSKYRTRPSHPLAP
jgi:hypothetical protein